MGCAGSNQRSSGTGLGAPPSAQSQAAHPPPRLSAEELAQSKERYEAATVLRALLTHDEARGGVPIRLLRARWLLEFFQSPDNAGARLEHRQQLEREQPEAFVQGEMLERVLAEVESGAYMVKAAEGGGYTPTANKEYEDIAFPSAAALSHMWLAPEHPDPHGRNLRDEWLPALEWFYSERVRQLTLNSIGDEDRAKDAAGAPLTDEAVLEAADFGVFIDLSSMPQKEGGERTDVEDALFRHALESLDVIYAHRALALFLSTRLPAGVDVSRGYYDRGWCARARAQHPAPPPRVSSDAPCAARAAGPTLSARWAS